MNGTVKFFNKTKGFGFIKADDESEYFVHISGINEGVLLNDGDEVTFDVENGERGPKAVNVSKGGSGSSESSDSADDSSQEASEDF